MRSFAALLTVGLLAACSSASSPSAAVLPALRVVTLGLDVGHLFLSDAALNTVTIFNRAGGTKTLSGFSEPQGISTDGTGTLYVADTVNQRVQEFAPPYPNNPSGSLSTPGESPVSVAVAKNGTVAAIIICKGGGGSGCTGPGSVEFFANNHASSPCATVSGGTQISRLLWGAFDAGGTLYVAGVNNYTTARIGRIAGGCSATSLSVLQPTTSISFVAGVQVDTRGHVAIVDSRGFSGAPFIDVFSPPKPGSTKLKLLTQGTLNDSGVVSSFTLRRDGNALYTAEPHDSLEYTYPGGGSMIAQFSPPGGGDVIEGVAVTPAESP